MDFVKRAEQAQKRAGVPEGQPIPGFGPPQAAPILRDFGARCVACPAHDMHSVRYLLPQCNPPMHPNLHEACIHTVCTVPLAAPAAKRVPSSLCRSMRAYGADAERSRVVWCCAGGRAPLRACGGRC